MSTMRPQICCEPPVGLVTVLQRPSVTFYVSLSGSEFNVCQVAVWHDGRSQGWQDLMLREIDIGKEAAVTPMGQADNARYFTGSLAPSTQLMHFTLKFRLEGQYEWHWLNDYHSDGDGTVIIQGSLVPDQFEEVMEGCDQQWYLERPEETRASVQSWILSADVCPSTGPQSEWASRSVGLPRYVEKWFALVRHSAPWLGPRHGDRIFKPDKDAILVSVLRTDGLHTVILPLNGHPEVLTTVRGDDEGNIIVTSRNDGEDRSRSVCIVSVGKTIVDAIEVAVSIARRRLSNEKVIGEFVPDEVSPVLERWYDAFTYCTWNGLGQDLSEEKLLSALAQFDDNGLNFSNLVIDDNWQALDFKGGSNFEYRWSGFDANKKSFPRGLAHTIQSIRKAHPAIYHIAVWHGMFGYWGGIDPEGYVARSYKSMLAVKEAGEDYLPNGPITAVHGEAIWQMYEDFYAFLAQSGVDSVKADIQFMPDYLAEAPDRRQTIYAYQDAWVAAVEKHFQHRAIACMAQTPQILFHTFLAPSKRPPYSMRNSDDFFPDAPTSHAWHVFCNAHNALLTQHFNILPDWDMFQTAGQSAKLHAVARCVSGGPLYITDPPGEHDLDLIEQITATAVDGARIILRPETVAVSMEAYVRPHSDRLLRLGTTHQGVSILGLMNVGGRAVRELVSLDAFRGLHPGKDYIIRSHFGELVTGPMNSNVRLPVVSVEADAQSAEILTAAPVQAFKGIRFAVLGLLQKLTGAAAMRGITIETTSDESVEITVELKAVGIFGLWLADSRLYHAEDRVIAVLRIGDELHTIAFSRGEDDILLLDLEGAKVACQQELTLETRASLRIQIHSAGSV